MPRQLKRSTTKKKSGIHIGDTQRQKQLAKHKPPLTVQAHPRTQPFVLTVLWMDLEGEGCRDLTEWLLLPFSAAEPSLALFGDGDGDLFPRRSLFVVLETIPLTFSSEYRSSARPMTCASTMAGIATW